jgi:hypothetical protein
MNNWKKLTNSRNRVRKKSFGGTFCFSNNHIIRLDTGGLVFLVSGIGLCVRSGGIPPSGGRLFQTPEGYISKDIYILSYIQKGYFQSFFGAGYFEDIISYF